MAQPSPQSVTNPGSLRKAVKMVLSNNRALGYPAQRFSQITQEGEHPDLLRKCEELVMSANALAYMEKAVTHYNGFLTLEDCVARWGGEWGFSAQAVEYAKKREQFGRPISEFQGLQWILADARIQLDAARLLLHRAAVQEDPKTGFPDMHLAAIAKTFSAEASIKVTNDALQIFGAAGYSRDLPIERMARDVRMFTIGGGTTQAQRNVIASGIFGRKFSQRRGG